MSFMSYKKFNPTRESGGASENSLLEERSAEDTLLASLGGNNIEITLPIAEDTRQDSYIPVKSSSTGSGGRTSNIEDRALSLLGSGIQAEQVAAALGVSPSRIAQLLSEEYFSKQVADLRYDNLQKHNKRDDEYDGLEDKLLKKLTNALPLLIKPRDIIDALSKINGAKRRGKSAPTTVNNQQNIVAITLPTIIAEKFAIDINNQVTKAGSQELLTMPSGDLLKQVEDAEELRIERRKEHPADGI